MSENVVNLPEFQLIGSFKFNDTIPIKKYKSNKSGLNVVFADVKGPIVYGFFILATEALDNDGLPHTLEHLIFLGSESYCYKGTLDAMANLCLSSGTNAWTDTDHTAYTMTSAGSDGFTTLLPVYLDHIFFPTLTNSGFITEVHHITGEGNDAGVVYCEMQGRETSGEQLSQMEIFRNLYPGVCGYQSETGGIVKNLRTTTTIDKVRAYHRQFYRPENCTLIITGRVEPDEVFRVLGPVEERLIQEIERREPFVKPWQSPVPILTSSIVKEIKYPSDKEDNGLIFRAWQGPRINDQKKLIACNVLLEYLTETAAAPLIKNLVEIPDQFCSDVSYMTIDNAIAALILVFEDVDLDRMHTLNNVVNTVLREVVRGEGQNGLKLERIRTILEKSRLKQILKMEKNPHSNIARVVITDMIYSAAPDHTSEKFNPNKILVRLVGEPKQFWVDLLKEIFIEGPHVLVLAYPSEAEYERYTTEEAERIAERVQTLGPDGLTEKQQILERAIIENSRMPPDELLATIPVPSIEKVDFLSMTNYNTDSELQHPLFNTKNCPVYMHLDDVDSHFVYLHVVLNTESLPTAYRPYLPLFLEYVLDSAILRDGRVIPYEQISMEMEEEILIIGSSLGINSNCIGGGLYSYGVLLTMQLEPNEYLGGIRWIREILYQTIMDPARLAIFAKKMMKRVSQYRRDGNSIVNDLIHGMLYKPGTNIDKTSALVTHAFLTGVLSKLEGDNDIEIENIVNDLETLRSIITTPENMVIHLAANIETLASNYPNPSAFWADVLPGNVQPRRRALHIPREYEYLAAPENRLHENCVTAIAGIDTAFLVSAVPSIHDFNHADLPTVLVFIQYMTQLEGPLWRSIRGLGLAYHYDLLISVCEGLLYLTLYKATDVIAAYQKTKEIFTELLSQDSWSEIYFKAAKSSLIYHMVEKEKNIKSLVFGSLYSYFTRTGHNYNRELITAITNVNINDMTRIGKEYFEKLFDPQIARIAIVCHGSKLVRVSEEFKNFGFNMDEFKNLDESFLNPNNPNESNGI